MEKTAPTYKITERIESIDLIRGIAIAFMVLDHVRSFFSNVRFNPLDLRYTEASLFITRWITHPFGPTFIFLAGTSAYLSLYRGKSKRELSLFLLTRGLWLIFLELTIVNYSWTFSFTYEILTLQVIWAIGWSMIVLSVLIFLPLWCIAAFGLATVLFHNMLDQIFSFDLGSLSPVWKILHEFGKIELHSGRIIRVVYPLIPWIGVIALGYSFGSLFLLDKKKRSRIFLWIGILTIACFAVIRYTNSFGANFDYFWKEYYDPLYTFFSFFNCMKYPPSLLFLMMTLGPMLIFLGLFEKAIPRGLSFFATYGRVPMFFYLLHLPVIHLLAVGFFYIRYGEVFTDRFMYPAKFGFSLPVVYLLSFILLLIFFPLCRWYASLKKKSNSPFLRYI
ncbi:DUF1624 domain-containing protein [Spirochaetota bacterium]